jgi:DNA-binding NtrC family response regulator
VSDGEVVRPAWVANVPFVLSGRPVPSTIRRLKDLEREEITRALALYGKDRKAMAAALGISVKGLYVKLHRYGLDQDIKSYARRVHV